MRRRHMSAWRIHQQYRMVTAMQAKIAAKGRVLRERLDLRICPTCAGKESRAAGGAVL